MLEFINNNSVLFSGIFSIIGILISTFATIIHDNRKTRRNTSAHPRKKPKKPKARRTHKSKRPARSVENGKKLPVSINIRCYADHCNSCEFYRLENTDPTDHGKYEKTV